MTTAPAQPASSRQGLLARHPDVSSMDAEEQDFLGISTSEDAPTTDPPLDTLAKRLADGTISRRQALKLMGAGAAAASLALAGCGSGKDQGRGSTSGSREPSGGST